MKKDGLKISTEFTLSLETPPPKNKTNKKQTSIDTIKRLKVS